MVSLSWIGSDGKSTLAWMGGNVNDFSKNITQDTHNQSFFNYYFYHNEMYSCSLLVAINFGGMVNRTMQFNHE